MTREEAIQVRTAQLQGQAVNPETLAAAIEIIKTRPKTGVQRRGLKNAQERIERFTRKVGA